MKVYASTLTGNIRTHNEDCVYVHMDKKPFYVLVADGMGGAAAGEVASMMTAYCVKQFIEDLKKEELSGQDLAQAVTYANDALLAEIRVNDKLTGMGSTVTLAGITQSTVTLAHVGDSSAYLFSDNTLTKLTKDHTYVQRLLDAGKLNEETAKTYPLKNVITRAVGMTELCADVSSVQWKPEDILLLCSDGLTCYADASKLQELLREPKTPEEIAEKLIDFALQAGGKDNISVAVIQNTQTEGEA